MRALGECWHNPSSVHRAGQAARAALELARRDAADLIGAAPRQVIFTSGGTESIDMAIRGVLGASGRDVLVTTPVEHAAVRDLAEHLARRGSAEVRWVGTDRDGRVDLDALSEMIDERVALVSVQWANNETGVIQPVDQIGRICRQRGTLFHCDAVQWVGKMPVDLSSPEAPAIDLLSASAHKFHGPKGVGLLWARRGVRLEPTILGSHELGRRGGTQNVPGILGAGVACREAIRWLADQGNRDRVRDLRDEFERRVVGLVPGAAVNGPTQPDQRIWNTSNIAFPGLEAEALLMLLSERGLCASAGAACSSGSLDPSPVLLAMGVPERLAHGSLRFSLCRHTSEQDIERGADIVAESVRVLRGSSSAVSGGAIGGGGTR